MTTINELQVHDGFIVANVTGVTAVKLDGWSRYRPIVEFSWYDPWLIVGSTEKPLKDGERTLTVVGPAEPPASRAFTMGEPAAPEPPPPSRKWRTEKIAGKRSDWKSTLVSIPGATITDSHLPGTDTPALRYWVPGPDDYGGDSRCEVQVQPAGVEGEWRAYEWGLWVPERTVVPTFYGADDSTTVAQHHGNDRATYTGGVGMQKDGTLLAKISGGSQRGKNDYEYEERLPFGVVERNRLHVVRLEILWHRSEGHYLAYFDGEVGAEVHDVPTWPIGEADDDPTDNIMWRLGWYPQGGRVAGPMEMWTTPCEFEVGV